MSARPAGRRPLRSPIRATRRFQIASASLGGPDPADFVSDASECIRSELRGRRQLPEISATFAPKTTGTLSANLQFTSNASSSPTTVSLSRRWRVRLRPGAGSSGSGGSGAGGGTGGGTPVPGRRAGERPRPALPGSANAEATKLAFTLSAGANATTLKTLVIRLPDGLTFATRTKILARGITVTAANGAHLKFTSRSPATAVSRLGSQRTIQDPRHDLGDVGRKRSVPGRLVRQKKLTTLDAFVSVSRFQTLDDQAHSATESAVIDDRLLTSCPSTKRGRSELNH